MSRPGLKRVFSPRSGAPWAVLSDRCAIWPIALCVLLGGQSDFRLYTILCNRGVPVLGKEAIPTTEERLSGSRVSGHSYPKWEATFWERDALDYPQCTYRDNIEFRALRGSDIEPAAMKTGANAMGTLTNLHRFHVGQFVGVEDVYGVASDVCGGDIAPSGYGRDPAVEWADPEVVKNLVAVKIQDCNSAVAMGR